MSKTMASTRKEKNYMKLDASGYTRYTQWSAMFSETEVFESFSSSNKLYYRKQTTFFFFFFAILARWHP